MTTIAVHQPDPLALPPLGAAPPEETALRRRLLEVLQAPVQPVRVTYAEFLAWADEDTLAEWVDGEIIMTSPASLQQQTIAGFLFQVMSMFAETHQLGVVISAPFQMRLARSGREPDLLFVSANSRDRLQATFLDGAADLVVEIISPESVGRDRGEKFNEYEAGGVTEYWLIDPQRQWADFYYLEEGRYRLVFAGAAGDYQAQVLPGLRLQVAWFWQQPLPPVLAVLRELGLI